MVLQTIGQGAVFASLNGDIKNIVLIGNLTSLATMPRIFSPSGGDVRCPFQDTEYAEYRTAIRGGFMLYQEPGI